MTKDSSNTTNKNIKDTIIKAIQLLKAGEVIAFPTETVYGIWCLINKPEAIQKIFDLKKREKKPLQILFPYKNMLKNYANIRSLTELKIIKKCMPWAITLLLEKKDTISEEILCGSPYIGTRIPDSPIIQELLLTLDLPLVATSANITGEKELLSAEAVENKFWKDIPLIIDWGECKDGLPSTVLTVENEKIKIFREGALSEQEILEKIS